MALVKARYVNVSSQKGATSINHQFINLAIGRPVARVGSGLACCTKKVQRVSCTMPGDSNKDVLLVDTPAFDHDKLDLPQIEDMIRKQLKDMYDSVHVPNHKFY